MKVGFCKSNCNGQRNFKFNCMCLMARRRDRGTISRVRLPLDAGTAPNGGSSINHLLLQSSLPFARAAASAAPVAVLLFLFFLLFLPFHGF